MSSEVPITGAGPAQSAARRCSLLCPSSGSRRLPRARQQKRHGQAHTTGQQDHRGLHTKKMRSFATMPSATTRTSTSGCATRSTIWTAFRSVCSPVHLPRRLREPLAVKTALQRAKNTQFVACLIVKEFAFSASATCATWPLAWTARTRRTSSRERLELRALLRAAGSGERLPARRCAVAVGRF